MKIFIDTANIEEIENAGKINILDGVTTNPSLIAREKKRTSKKFYDIVEKICIQVDNKPVSVEVLSTSTSDMIQEGLDLNRISGNIVVKLPCIKDALEAINVLSKENIETNLTLCFSPLQAWLVAKSGASYVSPFVGRLDDISQDGMSLISQIKQIYFNYGFPTQILVASIRHPMHILNAALIGADIVTVPYTVINELMKHPKTDEGLDKFLKDAKSIVSDENK